MLLMTTRPTTTKTVVVIVRLEIQQSLASLALMVITWRRDNEPQADAFSCNRQPLLQPCISVAARQLTSQPSSLFVVIRDFVNCDC